MTTDYLYTGQRQEAEVGLYYYVARWYDPAIGRFIQADSMVPNPGSAVGFDRYRVRVNNPLKYSDPSGHFPLCVDGVECFTLPGYTGEEQWELRGNKIKKPDIVSREEWGAHAPGSYGAQNPAGSSNEGVYSNQNPDGYYTYDENVADIYHTITIHHEGDDATKDVRAVQEAEMNSGFYDIGYHFVIGSDGTIYEGRDIGREEITHIRTQVT